MATPLVRTTGPGSAFERQGDGTWPSVSVVVPVYNGASDLRRCLAALGSQDYPGDVQVVVADNASTDDPASVVAEVNGAVLVREARPGSYAARNAALQITTGVVVAFTDADCEPEADWLRRSVAALAAAPRAAMVGGRVQLSYSTGVPHTGSELYESVHGFPQESYLADQHFAVTANMVTWRSVLDEVGHFDASLMSRGDAQWGQRVHAAGMLQRYAADAVVRHPARATLTDSVTKWRRVARGKVANDLAAGHRPRHFAGLLAHQVRMLTSAVTSGGEAVRLPSPAARARYLSALALCRVLTCLVYAQGGVRAAFRRGGDGRP